MKEEMLILQGEQQELKESSIVHQINTEVMENGTDKTQIDIHMKQLHTDATELQTKAVMRLSMGMMKLGAIFMVGEMLLMMFKDALPFVKDETDAARYAMILMTAGMMLMTAEMVISMGATMALAGSKGADATASFAQMRAKLGVIGAMKAYTFSTMQAVRATFTLNAAISWGAFLALAAGIVYAIDKMIPKIDEYSTGVLDMADASDEVAASAASMAADMNSAFDNIDYGFLMEGTDAMDSFANAREEMFFGFKAGAVTGDLVKQVQQGGVENFVANTEIIMNNNFNGMTTEEVADEIIGMIERKAGLSSGLNASIIAS
jgi:hypothetical protein